MTARSDITTADLRDWVAGLHRVLQTDDSDRISQLRLLEELKAAAGAQARITLELDASQRAEQQAAGAGGPRLARRSVGAVWLRRLYTRPGDNALIALESTRQVRRSAARLHPDP